MAISGNMDQDCSSCTVDVCASSDLKVFGNWTSQSGGSTVGVSACGKIEVSGVSTCSFCHVTGFLDICDTTGSAPFNFPKIDNNNFNIIFKMIKNDYYYVNYI